MIINFVFSFDLLNQLVFHHFIRIKMDELNIKLISNFQCELGEGPAFDHRNDTFYQVDILQNKIIKITFKGSEEVPQSKVRI